MKTDKEKAIIYDKIVDIISRAREAEENDERDWDSPMILEEIEILINE